MCPSKNVICPKCGGHHENCDTTLFSCVNCTGDHISLSKACPVYKKERKLREIMAEFGCTYRKALEMYVPPEMPLPSENDQLLLTPKYGDTFRRRSTEPTPIQNIYPNLSSQPTYADTVKTKATIHEEKKAVKITSRPQKSEVKPKCQKKSNDEDWTFWNSDGGRKGLEDNMSSEEDDLQKEQCPSLKELWVRIKEVIYLKQLNLSSKIRSILQLCLEWFMLVSKLIRQGKVTGWQNFCTSVDHTSSASEMWHKMRWLKGCRSPSPYVDSQNATNLLYSLTPDYVSPMPPTVRHSNPLLECQISIQELNNCIKPKDTSPGCDDISYSMIKNLPDVEEH
ncbi:hypothetical protein HW555_002542 [Spodoptera exigua]|nr:hypothetical protein HW555_002542 [Spodoptera exigua]